MSWLIRLLPRWRGRERRERQKEEEHIFRLFVDPESKMQEEDGLYPERYTLAEIREKLEKHFSRKVGGLGLIWWLVSPHQVSYWQVYSFRKLGGSGESTVFGIHSWDRLGP